MHNRSPPFAFLANKTGAANGENDSFIHPFDKNTPSCFFSSSNSCLDNLYILGDWYLKLGSKSIIAWSKPGLVIGTSSSGLQFSYVLLENVLYVWCILVIYRFRSRQSLHSMHQHQTRVLLRHSALI